MHQDQNLHIFTQKPIFITHHRHHQKQSERHVLFFIRICHWNTHMQSSFLPLRCERDWDEGGHWSNRESRFVQRSKHCPSSQCSSPSSLTNLKKKLPPFSSPLLGKLRCNCDDDDRKKKKKSLKRESNGGLGETKRNWKRKNFSFYL